MVTYLSKANESISIHVESVNQQLEINLIQLAVVSIVFHQVF